MVAKARRAEIERQVETAPSTNKQAPGRAGNGPPPRESSGSWSTSRGAHPRRFRERIISWDSKQERVVEQPYNLDVCARRVGSENNHHVEIACDQFFDQRFRLRLAQLDDEIRMAEVQEGQQFGQAHRARASESRRLQQALHLLPGRAGQGRADAAQPSSSRMVEPRFARLGDQNCLMVAPRGPILSDDFQLLERFADR